MAIESKRLDDIRIRRPKEHDDLLDTLKKEKIFSSNKNALVFAASLGFKKQQRQSFEESSEPIMLRIFDDNTDIPFIYSLALAETNDISMMTKTKFKDAVLIFEEYANGGLAYMKSLLDPVATLASIEAIIAESDEGNTEDMFEGW
jgi:dnd system-associated protein 4